MRSRATFFTLSIILSSGTALVLHSVSPISSLFGSRQTTDPQFNAESGTISKWVPTHLDSVNAILKIEEGSQKQVIKRGDDQQEKQENNEFSDIAYWIEKENLTEQELNEIGLFIDSTSGTFEYLKDIYYSSDDTVLQAKILSLISQSANRDKVTFAFELLDDDVTENRQTGYNWLYDARAGNIQEVNHALEMAIFTENNPQLLTDLILTTHNITTSKEPSLQDLMLSRLREVAIGENEALASAALIAQVIISPNEQVRYQLRDHLYGSSEILQLAAIKGLHYYDDLAQNTLERLREISLLAPTESNADLRFSAMNLLIKVGDYDPDTLPIDIDADD